MSLACLPGTALAIEAREVLITVQASYAHPLSPQEDYTGLYGAGFHGSIEKALDDQNTIGLMFSDTQFHSQAGASLGTTPLDLIGRHFWAPLGWLNPYVLLGVGANFLEPFTPQPFGDVLHGQAAVGSLFVLSPFWALDYSAAYHLLAPLSAPYSYAELKLGLNYRFGGQPRVNFNKPPEHAAIAVETIPRAAVDRIIGHFSYTVRLGDSLAKIAQRHLGDEQLWPLLDWQNQGTIKDPFLIRPGQTLEINHRYSGELKSKALQMAWATHDLQPRAESPTALAP